MEVFVTKTYQKVGLFLMAVPRLFEFLGGSVWCVVLLFHHSVYLFSKLFHLQLFRHECFIIYRATRFHSRASG